MFSSLFVLVVWSIVDKNIAWQANILESESASCGRPIWLCTHLFAKFHGSVMDLGRTIAYSTTVGRDCAGNADCQLETLDTSHVDKFWPGAIKISSIVWKCGSLAVECLSKLYECGFEGATNDLQWRFGKMNSIRCVQGRR